MNKIIVIGNLGRDPEMRYTPNGQGVTSFSVASSLKYTTAAGESREEVEWFNCSAFGKLAETCDQYLTKGKQIYVEGRLKSRTYQTQGGGTRHSNDVTITEVQFLGQRGEGGGDTAEGAAEAAGHHVPDDDLDDLPFWGACWKARLTATWNCLSSL